MKSVILEVYDSKLTAKEMAKLAGIKNVSSVRQYLKQHSLKYKKQKNYPKLVERYEKGELPPWYDPSLTAKEMTARRGGATIASTVTYLCYHKLPYKHRDIAPRNDDYSWWYDPNKTIYEMVEISGRTHAAIRMYLTRRNLPYKTTYDIKREYRPDWYNPNLTTKQMAEIAGRSRRYIGQYVRLHHLPFVRERKPYAKDKNSRVPKGA